MDYDTGDTGHSGPSSSSAADRTSLPRSVISNDLTIIGTQLRIISKSTLQVDGAIEGDVQGAEVVIGPLGRVMGSVIGEKVTVEGQVQGTIRGIKVNLSGTARVDGEIHHQLLSIDQDAQFEGTVRRGHNARELLGDASTE